MKTKKYWVVLHVRHDNGKDDAIIIPVTESDNIANKLSYFRGIVSANIYDTKKAAVAVVLGWRAVFIANNTYYWQTMDDGSPAPF